MKTTKEFLQDVKTRHHLPSDYALAGKLGLTRASISTFMLGKSYLGDDTAMKVAELLDLDPAYVVACIHAERAKHEGEKRLWERIAALASGVTVALLLAGFMPQFDGGFYALGFTAEMPTLYIMLNCAIAFLLLFHALPRLKSLRIPP